MLVEAPLTEALRATLLNPGSAARARASRPGLTLDLVQGSEFRVWRARCAVSARWPGTVGWA